MTIRAEDLVNEAANLAQSHNIPFVAAIEVLKAKQMMLSHSLLGNIDRTLTDILKELKSEN